MNKEAGAKPYLIGGDANTELASQRTAMSFDRTALSSDSTLMAVVRTALSLIGFGFTIFQFFHKLNKQFLANLSPEAPRRFGATLIVLGVVLLSFGIYNHARETIERRRRRQWLFELRLIRYPEVRRPNSAMLIAILLLATGILAVMRVAAQIGPF